MQLQYASVPRMMTICDAIPQYGTAQLLGNVHTRQEHSLSSIHIRCIRNMCETHPECTQETSMQVQNLMIKLQQDLINCHALFHPEHMQDACRTRLGCMRGVFWMRANIALELSCTVYIWSEFQVTDFVFMLPIYFLSKHTSCLKLFFKNVSQDYCNHLNSSHSFYLKVGSYSTYSSVQCSYSSKG